MTTWATHRPLESVAPIELCHAPDRLPTAVIRNQIAQRLSAGTIVLLRDSETGRSYAMSLAQNIEAFTLERLESLASQPAALVLGASLIRRWDLRHGQSVDAVRGIGVGCSTADRARTMRVAASMAPISMLRSPGHVSIHNELDDVIELGFRLAWTRANPGAEAFVLSPLCAPAGTYLAPHVVAQDVRLAHLPLIFTRRGR
jgi:hypothetical protein